MSSLEEREVTERFSYLDARTIREMERAKSQMVRTDPRMTGRVQGPPVSPRLPAREKVPEKNS